MNPDDCIFNFVVDNNTREEKLVTPLLMNLDGNKKAWQSTFMVMKK